MVDEVWGTEAEECGRPDIRVRLKCWRDSIQSQDACGCYRRRRAPERRLLHRHDRADGRRQGGYAMEQSQHLDRRSVLGVQIYNGFPRSFGWRRRARAPCIATRRDATTEHMVHIERERLKLLTIL